MLCVFFRFNSLVASKVKKKKWINWWRFSRFGFSRLQSFHRSADENEYFRNGYDLIAFEYANSNLILSVVWISSTEDEWGYAMSMKNRVLTADQWNTQLKKAIYIRLNHLNLEKQQELQGHERSALRMQSWRITFIRFPKPSVVRWS